MINSIDDKIRVIQLEINIESDSEKKQDLQKRLKKYQLQREIEQIKKRIEQLG